MKTAFVMGGTGFVGRHVARRLADAGCEVTVGSRGRTSIPQEVADLRSVTFDRSVDALRGLLGNGVDVLVDVIPYEIGDAQQLLEVQDLVGSIAAISTTSVYADANGRTLDEATGESDSPHMPVPISESQPRTQPGTSTYSTKKAAIEEVLLDQDDIPVSVIRPCAIYGPGDTQCREWFFVKRALDKRPFVLLADEGESIFHTTSVHNLAEMIRLIVEVPIHGAFNCGDPDPPDVLRIAQGVAAATGHEWEETLVPRALSEGPVLDHPWRTRHPWVVDMSKSQSELDYEPVTSFDAAIGETVDWIREATAGRDWREVLPRAADYLGDKFEYAAEDRLRASL